MRAAKIAQALWLLFMLALFVMAQVRSSEDVARATFDMLSVGVTMLMAIYCQRMR